MPLTGRSAALLAVIAVIVLAPPAPADSWFGDVSCDTAGHPGCELTAGTAGEAPTEPGPATETESGATPAREPSKPCRPDVPPGLTDPAEQAAWRAFACSGTTIASDSFDTPAPAVAPADVAAVARERLQIPALVIASSPAGDQLVHLPTWLWLPEGWTTITATASVPGVTVTATATPTTVTWTMGDGTTVTCAGPGTPYRAGADPGMASPDCGHVYRRTSAAQPGHTFAVTATVHWTVTWSGAGRRGTFPDITTTAATRARVVQAQALNVTG